MAAATKHRVGFAVLAVLLVALAAVGAGRGERPGLKRDLSRPSAPTGIRVTSASQTVQLAWKASTDNRRVAGYDVYVDSKQTRVTGPDLRLRGFVCGQVVPMRVVAFDRANNRSKPTKATIQIPGCWASTPGWFGGFETGNLSEWDHLFAATPDRFQVVTSNGGVVPRQGSHMARVEVRGDEPASWATGANVALVEKNSGPDGSGRLGSDTYVGFSLFLPTGFPYVPNQLMNNIAEWHGDSSDVQASVHLTIDSIIGNHYGISNPRPGFVLDLHTQPGYNPVMFRFGDLVTGRWVDFVFRTKWATDSSGIIEGWMDGIKKFSSSRKTWYSGGQISIVKPQLGYYRAKHSQTAVLFLDAYKIGTSYKSVAP